MQNVKFVAEVREASQGRASQWRLKGYIPGVIYGGKKDPISIAITYKDFLPESKALGFFSRLYTLNLGEESLKVIAKEIQYHPVTDHPIHVDFQRVNDDTKVHIFVPVRYLNEDKAPGIKMGGILNVIVHNLEVVCSATNIPDHIDVDLTGLAMGHSIHLERIELPTNVVAAHPEKNKVLATIAGHSGSDETTAST
jgi:large subunit ribosomal protein L25